MPTNLKSNLCKKASKGSRKEYLSKKKELSQKQLELDEIQTKKLQENIGGRLNFKPRANRH